MCLFQPPLIFRPRGGTQRKKSPEANLKSAWGFTIAAKNYGPFGRSSDSRIILVPAPSRIDSYCSFDAVASLRVSSSLTAAGPCRILTGLPSFIALLGQPNANTVI